MEGDAVFKIRDWVYSLYSQVYTVYTVQKSQCTPELVYTFVHFVQYQQLLQEHFKMSQNLR